ncbi:16S rRNA (cytosine(967)-C(5))-methyltransferase [Aetokthonos hydrillicola Thurmond2011]|uniref:16S rRNA (cytosine(967)-C(5))-methyltransferase n=1 Tax=Aetokthonos hydrillicola Thurmond2011 TaxID=2712845 RepID=A0AAP5IDK0_9CYAN|nr:16S rRNA (cytosine(967)-C(5))-methyltransferase [Aetokthonos hydrillicola]MBO3459750.1 16S rRNA (cytosine(967)-C(5))-methyltransferase [Aetokthonos hydrillicola CCALA 1050]MBW4585183.1 16S rRNA (cytosine(967)-C(5))-methyltransferase [Aetokthonos hydrillicola CCALA 1050]MDR9899521.1 16S rRNA (cytosine(967)-C(5))-methyltransferase [Aetokthonos hydrillicola Thurmond2011]
MSSHSPHPPHSPRQLAFIGLRDVHKGAYVDIALDRVLQKVSLPDHDRRLVTELVYGCARRQRTLDFLIDQLGKKKSHQQPKDLRTILHLGLYQLRYQERIPDSAAVNTTVQLAKENGFSGLTGFVNGLLRQYIRLVGGEDGSTSEFPPTLKLPENPVERLGILYSFPDWMIQVWIDQLGFAQTEELCQWMNKTPAIDLRVNPLRTSFNEVQATLESAGILSKPIPHLPQALRLIGSSGAIQNLPGFNEGWWTVQDSSAQLVGHLLDPQKGEVVIDACAAPGGKTTHIAELMGDKGKIWACDSIAHRLNKLKENIQRLKLQSIEICIGDSRNLPQFKNSGDRVLLDAPCSGLGTLHRHADARWRQTPETVQELSVLQKELLSHTSTFVKDGGVLVYATCTLHPKENEDVVSSFLAEHPNWVLEPPSFDSPAGKYSTTQGWIKVYPHQYDMDGFFMARLRKIR